MRTRRCRKNKLRRRCCLRVIINLCACEKGALLSVLVLLSVVLSASFEIPHCLITAAATNFNTNKSWCVNEIMLK